MKCDDHGQAVLQRTDPPKLAVFWAGIIRVHFVVIATRTKVTAAWIRLDRTGLVEFSLFGCLPLGRTVTAVLAGRT